MSDLNRDPKKKQRLGRGLGSLFGEEATDTAMVEEMVQDKSAAASAPSAATPAAPAQQASAEVAGPPGQRIWSVGVDKVFPNKSQPRKEFDADKIKELSLSIQQQGILQPITVRKMEGGGYEIIAGERRWRAAQQAGLHEVPVIIKEADNKKVMEWALIENIQREDLNPIEEAEAYNQLISDYKYTHQELADKMGKERATVSNALRILTLPREIRELIREQKISSGHAKVLLGLENFEQQKSVAKDIVSQNLSVRALEKIVVKLKKGEPPTPVPTADEAVRARMVETLMADLQKSLGTKVQIDYSAGKGKISVQFYSDDELTSLVEKMKGQT